MPSNFPDVWHVWYIRQGSWGNWGEVILDPFCVLSDDYTPTWYRKRKAGPSAGGEDDNELD